MAFKNIWDDVVIAFTALLFMLGCVAEYLVRSECSYCGEKKRFKAYVLDSYDGWGFICGKCRRYL